MILTVVATAGSLNLSKVPVACVYTSTYVHPTRTHTYQVSLLTRASHALEGDLKLSHPG